MATRMQQRRGTAEQWNLANPVLAAGEVGFETDTGKFKVGDGVNFWDDLAYFVNSDDLSGELGGYATEGFVLDTVNLAVSDLVGGAPEVLNTLSEISAAIGDDTEFFSFVNSINTKADQLAERADGQEETLGTQTTAIANINTTISSVQSDLEDKLDSSVAAGIYAPINDPTFGGTVSLPSDTSIGDVSSTEIGYVNGVTSAIQTQLNAKAPTADPAFTGTVSGITSSMVGLGNVDNTADTDKPVSTAQQTALNSKLGLAGGTMTGKIILDGDPTQALHAVTKQYADSISEGLHVHAAVVALSDSNIDLTGASPTTVIDGVTLADGDRVIINGQTLPEENGIYVYTLTGSVFNRAEDFDEPGEVAGGDFVFVTGGTLYENTGWVKTSDSVAVIGTDAINFTQFSGAGSVTAGTNVTVTGTQVAVVDSPVFSGTVDASASGVVFSDGTQTQSGVPSLTGFTQKTANYQLDTLDHKDNVVEMNMSTAGTFTVPLGSTLAWPVGASMDIFATGTGEITIAGEAGVTLNATPGLKLRTQWSSATIMKRGENSWVVYGDLKA